MHCKCIDEDFAHMDIASDCTNDYPEAKSAEDMPSLASARHHVMRECGPRSSALRMLLEALTHSIRSINAFSGAHFRSLDTGNLITCLRSRASLCC